MIQLTKVENSLIAALRENGREPVSSLAERIGVSRATVTKLMNKLEADGTIVGYTARINDGGADGSIRAISFIEVERTGTRAVISGLRGIPEIQTIHTTNGAWDLVIEITCASLAEFDRVLRKVRSMDGVVNSESSLLLTSVHR